MKNRKRISILLVLAMVMTMLSGLAAPAGATTPVAGVTIGHVPTVVGTGVRNLASIRFAESGASIGNIQDGDQITITLPSGVVFQDVVAATGATSPLFEGSNVLVTHDEVNEDATSVTLTLTRNTDDFTAASFIVKLPVDVTTVGSGAINVTLASTSTAITGGTFAVGTFGTGAITMDGTGTVGTVSRFALAAQLITGFTVRLAENAASALRPNTVAGTRLVLELPEGVTWNTLALPTPGGGISAAIGSNARRLNVEIASPTVNRTTFTLSNISLNVSRLAALGDLTVTVIGEGDNSGRVTGSVVLARVADFGIEVRRPTTGATTIPSINAGRSNGATVLNNMIEVKEATDGSLISGGTITLTLPAGVRFASAPTVVPSSITPASTVLSNGNRTATFDVTPGPARTVLFTFPANSLLVSPTAAAGDVAVTVAGTAGASGTVNIATVRPTFAISAATTPNVALGSAGQTAADLVITEAAFGRILAGDLELVLPVGVTFSGTPTVTVASGNIDLGTVSIVNDGRTLRINVENVSSVASVVNVSGIRYNISRTAMDGPINVTVDGPAVAPALGDVAVLAAFDATVAGNRPRVANARVGAARPTSVFTIGALTFVRDGVTTAIDAAPAIVDGRTLLPLRFAALAAGVSADDIIWDATRRTVTLLRGDRVVQLRIGDRNMTINGVVVPLDVPAAIQNGRTVLPIRAIAQALRADVAWNATARTVTITAQ